MKWYNLARNSIASFFQDATGAAAMIISLSRWKKLPSPSYATGFEVV